MNREEQGQARAGRISGTIAQRIMTAASRQTWNTIAEDLRNPRPFYDPDDTPNMPEQLRWGHEHEHEAAGQFWMRHPEFDVHNPRFLHWHDPTQANMVRHYCVSPDRMLTLPGHDTSWIAGLEIKCPFDAGVHAEVIRNKAVPDWCIWQIYHGMFVSGLTRWFFVCYDPRPRLEAARYFELEVPYEPQRMTRLISTLSEFLDGYTSGETFRPLSYTAADFDRMF